MIDIIGKDLTAWVLTWRCFYYRVCVAQSFVVFVCVIIVCLVLLFLVSIVLSYPSIFGIFKLFL